MAAAVVVVTMLLLLIVVGATSLLIAVVCLGPGVTQSRGSLSQLVGRMKKLAASEQDGSVSGLQCRVILMWLVSKHLAILTNKYLHQLWWFGGFLPHIALALLTEWSHVANLTCTVLTTCQHATRLQSLTPLVTWKLATGLVMMTLRIKTTGKTRRNIPQWNTYRAVINTCKPGLATTMSKSYLGFYLGSWRT